MHFTNIFVLIYFGVNQEQVSQVLYFFFPESSIDKCTFENVILGGSSIV